MKIALAYNTEKTEAAFGDSENLYINIHHYLTRYTNSALAIAQLKTDLNSLTANASTAIVALLSLDGINNDLREALLKHCFIDNTDFDVINDLIATFFTRFSVKEQNITVLKWLKPDLPIVHSWEPKLFVRYGNVELRSIDSFLSDKASVYRNINDIASNLDDEDFMYSSAKGRHWLDFSDVSFNLKRLMTNAGFYFSKNNPYRAFEHWIQSYLQGLSKADYWFAHDAYAFFFKTQNFLYKSSNRLVPYVQFPSRPDFYASIAGRKILIVTPFAEQINFLATSGRIQKLYDDFEIDAFDIFAVRADISTYPNRPQESWTETYEDLCKRIDHAFLEHDIDLFFASAGCYGIPICGYVHEKFGCASVYYGHYINSLFGILTGPRQTPPLTPNLDNWQEGDLASFTNFSKIDGGRYI